MQLMFQRLRNVALCASCIMPLHGTMRTMQQFSLHALASLHEVDKPSNPAPPVLVKPAPWFTVERAHNAISVAACAYALTRIARSYEHNMSTANKMGFALNAAIIIGEALVIKSLAKLLLVCATGDITDLIEQAIKRCKKMIMGG